MSNRLGLWKGDGFWGPHWGKTFQSIVGQVVRLQLPALQLPAQVTCPETSRRSNPSMYRCHHLIHPRIHTPIRRRVAHMQQPREEPRFLRRPKLHHQHTILNRHQPIMRPVNQQQPRRRHIDHLRFYQREVFLRIFKEFLLVLVTKLLRQRW